jgi:hypothetical protein
MIFINGAAATAFDLRARATARSVGEYVTAFLICA